MNNQNPQPNKRPVAPPKFFRAGPPTHTAAPATNSSDSKPKSSKPKRERKITQPVFESKFSGDNNETSHIPPLAPDAVRIIHLGGVEEIGRNMSMIEYRDSIVLVDCGVQFSESNTPGIDFILPNTKYIEERKDKIKALFITHGHLDHIGAIPYIMPRIGNPKIYTRSFTSLMIRKRQEEFPYLAPLNINIVEKNMTVDCGDLKVSFFAVSHAIPDSMGIMIETPYGNIVHTGDLRLDHDDGVPTEREKERYEVFKDKKVLCLMTDSTNCENPGFSISDRVVYQNIENVIRDTQGRLIISTFSSQVERLIYMIGICEKYGKKVIVEGRSMKSVIEVSKLAEMLHVKPDTIVPAEAINDYPPHKLVILATGQQGEEFAALSRMANKTHKFFKLNSKDTILLSSSVVPGNEQSVQRLKDNLSRQGAHLIHYKTSDVHSSGHANADELAWIHKAINPKFFIPVHGYHYLHRIHADIIKESTGMHENNVLLPDNGLVIEIQNGGEKIVALPERVSNDILVVDGTSVGKIADIVLRDRQTLGQDGIFAVIAVIDTHSKKLKKSPDIASRGFVYLKESQELLYDARTLIKEAIESHLEKTERIEIDPIRILVQELIAKFLVQRTAKKPVIMPIIITV